MTATAVVDGKKKVFVDGEWKDDFTDEGRFGTFRIGEELFDDPYTLMKVLGSFLINQCNYDPSKNQFVYYASSPLFHPTKLGDEVPEYELTFDSKSKIVSVEEK